MWENYEDRLLKPRKWRSCKIVSAFEALVILLIQMYRRITYILLHYFSTMQQICLVEDYKLQEFVELYFELQLIGYCQLLSIPHMLMLFTYICLLEFLSNNNNNNIHICIAPYGRNFRGAGPGSVLVGVRRGKRVSLGEEKRPLSTVILRWKKDFQTVHIRSKLLYSQLIANSSRPSCHASIYLRMTGRSK